MSLAARKRMNVWLDISLGSWRLWPIYEADCGYPFRQTRIALGPFYLSWRRDG